jgi:hypothetical protein
LVALSVGPAAATTVSDEVGFRSAWGNPNEQQIDLTADITLTCPGGEALRNSSTPVTVSGNGHTVRQTCAGQRVLEQIGSAAITFDGVTITGGTTPAGANGGGIRAPGGGTVTVANSTVMGNTAGGSGGGVAAAGAVGVTNSTVSGNSSSVNGGGVAATGAATITNSTISGNVATGNGAGVGANSTVTVTNSTIRDNVVGGTGGGIAQGTGAAITIRKSTISGNVLFFANGGASAVAGSTGGAVILTNSTISGNSSNGVAISAGGPVTTVYTTAADLGTNFRLFPNGSLTSFGSVVAGCFVDPTTTTSNGYNFSYDSSCGFTNTAQGDHQNAGDPVLGALADNGGPTRTRLPQAGSPLINAIPTASCQADGASGITTDQRGVTRPLGSGCDIGSVEQEGSPPSNRAPTVQTAAGDANGTEGDTLSTSGSFTDPDGDPLTIAANNAAGTFTDNGDGTWSWSLATNDDVAPAAVTVTATDPDGATASDDFAYSAVNADPAVAAPTVSATGACSANVSAAFSDAGPADTHTGTINWGDSSNSPASISESSGAGTATGSHTYASAGTFTVGVTVTDDDGGSASNSGSFATQNTPSGILPPIDADGTSNFKLGSTIAVKITVKDCSGNLVSTLRPALSLTKTGLNSGDVNEPVSSSSADSGNTMRWDPTTNQYIFNLSTKHSQFNAGGDLTAGHYVLTISDPSFFNNAVAEFDIKE